MKKKTRERQKSEKRPRKKKNLSHPVFFFSFDLHHQQQQKSLSLSNSFLQVEEISAAESHKKAQQAKADPLEEFCKDSPDAVSFRCFFCRFFLFEEEGDLFLFSSLSLFSYSFSPSFFLVPNQLKNRMSAASTRTRSFLLERKRESEKRGEC